MSAYADAPSFEARARTPYVLECDKPLRRRRWDSSAFPLGPLSLSSMKHDTVQAIAELVGQVIWAMTPEGELRDDSPSWRALTGQSWEEARESGWMDAVHPEDREQVELEVTTDPECTRLVVRDQGLRSAGARQSFWQTGAAIYR